MKLLLSKKGIKTKSASEVGRKKVDYFRGKDFKKFLLSKGDILKKKCVPALKAAGLDEDEVPTTEKDVERLGSELMMKGFCVRALYKPVNPSSKQGSGEKTKRWPDRLQRAPQQTFDCEGYYIIAYEGGSGMQHFLLALLIVGVLLACMFPAWPMWAKIGIWYLSVIFLILYFGILIIRLIVYVAFWIVGFDFWIFPNINDEYCGFLDSFQPIYSWEKRKDDLLMIFVRLGSLIIVAAALHEIGQTHSLSDMKDFIQHSFEDVIDWGIDKLMIGPGETRAALPSVDELKKQVETEEPDEKVSEAHADRESTKDAEEVEV
jgi:translocation protein SEC62